MKQGRVSLEEEEIYELPRKHVRLDRGHGGRRVVCDSAFWARE